MAAPGARPTVPVAAKPGPEVDLPPGVLTVGSLKHATGDCKPCFYIHTRVGCQYRSACLFCHSEDHPKRKRERPTKLLRSETKSVVEEVLNAQRDMHGSMVQISEVEEVLDRCPELNGADKITRKYAKLVLRSLYRDNGFSV